MRDGPLDMRMTQGEGMSAADVVNGAPRQELIRIFREFGEERMAPRIARAIVADRKSRRSSAPAARRDDRAGRALTSDTSILRPGCSRHCAST